MYLAFDDIEASTRRALLCPEMLLTRSKFLLYKHIMT